jgi:hypothetical protein
MAAARQFGAMPRVGCEKRAVASYRYGSGQIAGLVCKKKESTDCMTSALYRRWDEYTNRELAAPQMGQGEGRRHVHGDQVPDARQGGPQHATLRRPIGPALH